MAIRHFQRGQRPVFRCAICGRLTRDTGEGGDDHICGICYELAGQDNRHNDDGTTPSAEEMAFYESMIAKLAAKGCDAASLRREFSFIWQRKPATEEHIPCAASADAETTSSPPRAASCGAS